MTTTATQRVARNTAWFTVGSILQKLISFVYFTIIAMVFGVRGTGEYFLALTFTALFAVLADGGISAVLTREIAKDRAAGSALVMPAFVLKAMLALATAALITVIAYAAGYTATTRAMIGVATAVLALDSIHLGLYANLRGLQHVHYEAIGLVIGQFVLTVSGIGILIALAGLHVPARAGADAMLLAIRWPISPIWLLVPYLATSITNITIAGIGCVRERIIADVRLAAPASALRARIRWLARTAAPFAAAGILARVYTYSDTFLLSLFALDAVAYYSTPFKIAFAFQFIPLAFMGALYPAMSAAAKRSLPELRTLYEQGMRALAVIVLPIAVGIGVLADAIIRTLYGAAFAPSVLPLVLLIASLPFVFANFPAGNLLNAIDRQSTNTLLVGIATAMNIAANLALIPLLGATGAALSALIGSAVLAIANAIVVHRAIRYRIGVIAATCARALGACAVMAIVVRFVDIALPMRIAIGGIMYGVAVFAFGAVRSGDARVIAHAFRRSPRAAASESV